MGTRCGKLLNSSATSWRRARRRAESFERVARITSTRLGPVTAVPSDRDIHPSASMPRRGTPARGGMTTQPPRRDRKWSTTRPDSLPEGTGTGTRRPAASSVKQVFYLLACWLRSTHSTRRSPKLKGELVGSPCLRRTLRRADCPSPTVSGASCGSRYGHMPVTVAQPGASECGVRSVCAPP